MNTAHNLRILCHAAGWCEQSKAAFAKFEEKDGIAIRYDGGGFPHAMENDKSEHLKHFCKCIMLHNKRIFDSLYRNDESGYNVPKEFVVPFTLIIATKSFQGFDKNFITNCLPICSQLRGKTSILSGTLTLYYRTSCEHAETYLPLWETANQLCKEFCKGLYHFQKVADKLPEDTHLVITDLPLVVFTSNKNIHLD